MADRNTVVKDVPPGMSADDFEGDLVDRGSPAATEARRVYAYCAHRRLDARFLLGMFLAESSKGTDQQAICVKDNYADGQNVGPTRSWGNTTEPSFGDPGLGPPYVRGRFTRYGDWYAGAISTVARLFEHAPYHGKETVEQIIYTWAPPSDNNDTEAYIDRVVAEMNRLGEGVPIVAAPQIIDIRDDLPTNPKAKNGQKVTRLRTNGQVLHYSAVNYQQGRDIMDILRSEADFHIGDYLNERGIAYHYCVDWRDGKIYQTRDRDESLWHCGFWGLGGNGTGLAIHVPGGSNLHMSEVAVQSLVWLLGENERDYHFGRAGFKGHLELQGTSCPGPLMGQVVHPYRAGTLNYHGKEIVVGPIIDPVTGHTVHPDLTDSYNFDEHGRPLQPAVLYSDGKIRQLFERVVLAVGRDGSVDTVETLGHAFLFAAGEGRYPEWAGVHPLV